MTSRRNDVLVTHATVPTTPAPPETPATAALEPPRVMAMHNLHSTGLARTMPLTSTFDFDLMELWRPMNALQTFLRLFTGRGTRKGGARGKSVNGGGRVIYRVRFPLPLLLQYCIPFGPAKSIGRKDQTPQ